MAVRHERVIVDLDDRFSRPMAGMTAQTALFRRELGHSDRDVIAFDKTVRDTSPSIDKLSGRLAILGRIATALGPGLVPITTALVPAVAGLSTQLGFAAAGAGVTVLAFKGLGDAFEAVNKYQLEPTAENFAKVQEKMRGLGPAAQDFVMYLDDIMPRLQRVRVAAQEGILPGAQEGIDHLLTRLPQVRRIVSEVADTTGDLLASTGADLASDRWDAFFTFLRTEARPTLTTLGQTVGHLTSGLAELWMAMDPMSDDFTAGLLDRAAAFEKWASAVDETDGYKEFLAYVRETGPEVLDLLGSTANMLLQVGEAAAPMGGPVLRALDAVVDVVATIADSDIGTPLIAAAGAMSALTLATNAWGKVQGASAVETVKSVLSRKELTAATEALRIAEEKQAAAAVRARAAQSALIPTADKRAALGAYVAAQGQVAEATMAVEAAERKRAAGIRSHLAGFGKQAAVIGGLALATSGLADKTGLSNTASMALMGTIAGPWGAAIGGGVGLVMDLAGANDDLEASMRSAEAAANSQTISFTTQQLALDQLRVDTEAYLDKLNDANALKSGGYLEKLSGYWTALSDTITNTGEESKAALDRSVQDLLAMRTGLAHVFGDLNGGDMSMLQATDEELDLFASKIAPAATAAGLDLRQALLNGDWRGIADAVRSYNGALDSADGKSRAVGGALAELASQMEDNVTQADALKSALDSLFGVELSQSAAVDGWIAGLKDLKKQIAETNGVIEGNSEAALDNRAAIRSSVQDLQDRISADAAAGVSGDKLAGTLLRGRQAILDQAAAAGANRQKVAAYLRTLGMTPKNLATIIQTPGLMTAKQQVQALGKLYGLTPKQIATLIAQPGMGKSTAEIKALLGQYKLTPKQVQTILKLLGADTAIGKVGQLRGIYANLPREVVTSIITNHVDKFSQVGRTPDTRLADGGTVPGPRYPYGDKMLAFLAPGEEIISNRHGQADKFRADRAAGRIPAYAGGGTAHAREYERTYAARAAAAPVHGGGAAVVERVVETLPRGPVRLVLANGDRLDAYFDNRADGRISAHKSYPTGRRNHG